MRANEEDYSEEELVEIGRQARVELARRAAKRKDILEWGQQLFPEKFNLPFCHELHDYLVSIRTGGLTVTEAPRGHAKTTIKCFLIPIFQALEEPKTFRHYLSVQSTQEKALAINASIKHEIETNQELADLYGDQQGDVWADGRFVLRNGTVFSAKGAGQSIKGINHNNVRPDYIVVDDLYDDEDIHNPESTKKKNDWFWSTLYPARAKSRKNSTHIQGTAVNGADLLIETKGKTGVTWNSFKTVKSWEARTVLWPELNTWDQVMAEKDVTPETIWAREYQNERTDDAVSFIKRAWLYPPGRKGWEYDPATLKFNEHLLVREILLCVDPSIGESEGSDSSGLALIIKARYDDSEADLYYIVGLWNKRLTIDERVLLVKEIGERSLPLRMGKKGENGEELVEVVEKFIDRALIEAIAGFGDFPREVRRRTRLSVVIIPKVKSKITNLELKSKHFQNERVFLNQNIEKALKDLLVHQLTTNFPSHDDLRDAVLLGMDETRRQVRVTVG